jgi:hypothetical protein
VERDAGANTCIACHTPDGAAGVQVPAGQLDLTASVSDQEPDHLTSYRELLFADNEQELVGGVLQDVQVSVGFLTDADGNLVLDVNGDPIEVFEPVPVAPTMSVAGAVASSAFFAPFAPGGTHADLLSPAELKLVREWLDIGAQYYNDPFAVPP